MTRRSMNLNNVIADQSISEGSVPFFLKPAGKDYLWGGSRLNDDFSKGIDMEPLAETWECSTHPEGISVVDSGKYKGNLLNTVLKMHPEFLGTHPLQVFEKCREGELPVLIKLIDAKENLSVQVHPDDDYARKNEHGQLGKTEMWYVLDALENSWLVYGFCHDMEIETLKRSLKNETIEKYLQKVLVKKNDVFVIEAGQVHAIGAGVLVAEIQENSNLTYRMYDYGRLDKNRKPRELHIDKALDVAELRGSSEPRQPMRVLKFKPGCAVELLYRCKYFQVERMLLNTERCRALASIKCGSNSFQVLMCIDGCGVLIFGSEIMNFYKGDCVFIPADSIEVKLHGQAQFLKIGC